MKLYMFRAIPLPIIRNLFTTHSALIYVIQVCRQLSSRNICSYSKAVYKPFSPTKLSSRSICSYSKAVYKHVWHIPVPSVQWINSWWWAVELPETCRVSCRSKFGKLVHLVGFVTKKRIELYLHSTKLCLYRMVLQ